MKKTMRSLFVATLLSSSSSRRTLLLASVFLLVGGFARDGHVAAATALDSFSIRGASQQQLHSLVNQRPNDRRREQENGECSYVSCDFSTLTPGVYLDRTAQKDKLLADCGLSIRVDDGLNINVFDSLNGVASKNRKDDPDLGVSSFLFCFRTSR